MTADRVLLQMPIMDAKHLLAGDVAVVSNAPMDAAAWRFLAKAVELTASFHEQHEKSLSVLPGDPPNG